MPIVIFTIALMISFLMLLGLKENLYKKVAKFYYKFLKVILVISLVSLTLDILRFLV